MKIWPWPAVWIGECLLTNLLSIVWRYIEGTDTCNGQQSRHECVLDSNKEDAVVDKEKLRREGSGLDDVSDTYREMGA